jgi:hypothetical protein
MTRVQCLTFAFTDHPGIRVYAGLLHDFPFPVCGCDACEWFWEAEVDAPLEELVDAVVLPDGWAAWPRRHDNAGG